MNSLPSRSLIRCVTRSFWADIFGTVARSAIVDLWTSLTADFARCAGKAWHFVNTNIYDFLTHKWGEEGS